MSRGLHGKVSSPSPSNEPFLLTGSVLMSASGPVKNGAATGGVGNGYPPYSTPTSGQRFSGFDVENAPGGPTGMMKVTPHDPYVRIESVMVNLMQGPEVSTPTGATPPGRASVFVPGGVTGGSQNSVLAGREGKKDGTPFYVQGLIPATATATGLPAWPPNNARLGITIVATRGRRP